MAVLKVKSSTLMETLVATILIVIIFVVASLVLNNLFKVHVSQNTMAIEAHLSKLEYRTQYENIKLPYNEVYEQWNITIVLEDKKRNRYKVEAEHSRTAKVLERFLIITTSDEKN